MSRTQSIFTSFRVLVCVLMLFAPFKLAAEPESVFAVKDETKFRAIIPIRVQNFGFFTAADSGGFFDSIELEVSWWTLLGLPVSYNRLTWHIRNQIRVVEYEGLNIYLDRNELSLHPDLLKRFDDDRQRHFQLVLDSVSSGMTYDETQRAKRQKERREAKQRRDTRECERNLAVKQESRFSYYRNKGYEVSIIR